MTVKDIMACITEIAPLQWQEHYDNAGLQVGDLNAEVRKALICLDINRGRSHRQELRPDPQPSSFDFPRTETYYPGDLHRTRCGQGLET